MHKLLSPLYVYYCDNKKLMNLNMFIKFTADFDIFPSLLSKSLLAKVFGILSNKYEEESKIEAMLIDEQLFVQSMALCAMEVIYQPIEPNYKEKVVCVSR
jgi:hypothetical protein